MSTLQGQFINDSYRDLLQVSNNNIGVDETSRYVEDGEGTPSILSLSTTRVGVGTDAPLQPLDVRGNFVQTHDSGAQVYTNFLTYGGAVGITTQMRMFNEVGNNNVMISCDGDTFFTGGNVGVGLNNPTRRLHVDGDVSIGSGDAYYWQSGDAALRSTNKDIIFETYNTSPGTLTEKMKISAEGLVRIGGGTPAHILDVQTSWTNTFLARLDNLGGDSSAHGLLVKVARSDSNGILLGVHNNDDYKFYVQADGKVGIGTTSPVTILDLNEPKNDSNGDPLNKDVIMSFSKGDTGEARIGLAGMTSQVLLGALTDDLCIRSDGNNIRFGTASATRTDVTIDTVGRVGIGTTSPDVRLVVADNHSGDDVALRVWNSSTTDNSTSSLRFTNTSSTNYDHGYIIAGRTPNPYMQFGVADNVMAMHIDSIGNVGIGTTEPIETFHVSGRTYLQHESNSSVATFAQVRNTSNAGLFGNGAGLGGFQGSLNLWSSNAVAEGEPGGLAGGLANEFVSLDFTSAYAANADITSGYTAGRVGIIFEGLTQFQPGQTTTQNKSTSMAFGVYNQSSGHVEERMRIRSDGQHVYKATNSSQDDMWTLRRGFRIDANVRRRVRIILSNYEAAYIRIAAQRTNSGDSMVWYHGYFSYNFDQRYTNNIDSRLSSGTISVAPVSYINGGQAYYDFDFSVSASPATGSIVVESVAGNATVQVTTY